MSRQSTAGWRTVIARLVADRERLAVAVIGGGVGLAISAIALGGFVRYGRVFAGVLYSIAILLPVIGAAIALGTLWWVATGRTTHEPPLAADGPPERAVTRTEQPVGRETEWRLDNAASEWYRCRNGKSTDEIVDCLVEGAIRTLRTTRGLEAAAAREAVRSGTWTDDRVAAAFLADDLRQPFRERLRAAIDPGAAFERRVRRTLSAIEGIDDRSRSLEPALESEREPSLESAAVALESDLELSAPNRESHPDSELGSKATDENAAVTDR